VADPNESITSPCNYSISITRRCQVGGVSAKGLFTMLNLLPASFNLQVCMNQALNLKVKLRPCIGTVVWRSSWTARV